MKTEIVKMLEGKGVDLKYDFDAKSKKLVMHIQGKRLFAYIGEGSLVAQSIDGLIFDYYESVGKLHELQLEQVVRRWQVCKGKAYRKTELIKAKKVKNERN